MSNYFRYFICISFVLTTILIGACTGSKPTTQSDEKVKINEPKPILVDLKGRVEPKTVVSGLQKYELQVVKEADRATNQWVFIYNPEIITADEILKVLKYEQWSEDAWFYVE